MLYLKFPSIRTLVENISLANMKLEKILAESQSRAASYLDIHYPDGQDIIFLLGGKAVKAGRLSAGGREILTVTEAMNKMRSARQGAVSFYEISKMLLVVIMGTFIFEPTHGRLKTKLINFNNLLVLFARKKFTGYVELNAKHTLNYLTFLGGEPREGYFAYPAPAESLEFPVKLAAQLADQVDESGEINIYESMGEEGLHEDVEAHPAPEEPPQGGDEDRAEFTADILDLCLAAIYEDVFRIMINACLPQLEMADVETMLAATLAQVGQKYPRLFADVREREDGTPLPGGQINFERLLKAKKNLPATVRDSEFVNAMNELASARLQAMRQALPKAKFEAGIKALEEKVSMSRKAYQGNFTLMKFLYDIARLLEKARTE